MAIRFDDMGIPNQPSGKRKASSNDGINPYMKPGFYKHRQNQFWMAKNALTGEYERRSQYSEESVQIITQNLNLV